MRIVYKGESGASLTRGRVYTVLGIQIVQEPGYPPPRESACPVLFIIIPDDHELPGWYPESWFEVSDNRLSRYWVWTRASEVCILSHPEFAQSDLLWRLHDTDFWNEALEQDMALYKSILWDLLNEFGVLTHEKRLLAISEADEWLSRIRECLDINENTRCEKCLSRLLNSFSLPDLLHKEKESDQVKWTLAEYILGLFVSGQLLQDEECLQEVKAYLEGKQPFLGIYLKVPYLIHE
ncbi:MAG: hypothetical protein KatS3mg019_1597 [Fimbriimonadales bacterium]|nr:MAG: hypothetical protein KatS3mg019_1597 [Fimbriimonadales bacterium]